MIKLTQQGVYLLQGEKIVPADEYTATASAPLSPDTARENTIAYQIMRAHDRAGGQKDAAEIRRADVPRHHLCRALSRRPEPAD